MNDDVLAARLSAEAGRILRGVQRSAGPTELGTRALGDRGDRESQEYLARALAEHRPGDLILSEEAADPSARLCAQRVWIIDPLDGTREFSEGRKDWAVHVALWENGDLTAGALALPGIDRVLTSSDAPKQWPEPDRLRFAVSRTRASEAVLAVAEAMGAELVPMGSAGYKTGSVLLGEVEAYLHTGGQYEWDSAAPVAVARAAGLYTARANGDPLRYNNRDPYLPDLLVCNPHLTPEILNHLKSPLGRRNND